MDTPFNSNIFSATQDDFYDQVLYLKKTFHLATLDEALDFLDGNKSIKSNKISRANALITFDDGYLDNYELAFPVLKSLNAQATFFLPTGYIGAKKIFYGDITAFLLKNTQKNKLFLVYPRRTEIDLSLGIESSLMLVNKLYHDPSTYDSDLFLLNLSKECDVPMEPINNERFFMNWHEVKTMSDNGMAIGSHTHTHRWFSNLSLEDQISELETSRNIIEKHLGIKIETFAYPAGKKQHFTRESYLALRKTGYRAAFSYYGGVNLFGKSDHYNVLRGTMEPYIPHYRFRFEINVGSVFNVLW